MKRKYLYLVCLLMLLGLYSIAKADILQKTNDAVINFIHHHKNVTIKNIYDYAKKIIKQNNNIYFYMAGPDFIIQNSTKVNTIPDIAFTTVVDGDDNTKWMMRQDVIARIGNIYVVKFASYSPQLKLLITGYIYSSQ